MAKKESSKKSQELIDEETPDDRIQQRFLAFHKANPHVYRFIVQFTREALPILKQRGIKTYSVSAAIERARWHVNFEAKGYADFSMSNDFRSRYARLIMKQEPDLRGVFHLRSLARAGGDTTRKEAAASEV